MIGSSDQACWLAEACKLLRLLLEPNGVFLLLVHYIT